MTDPFDPPDPAPEPPPASQGDADRAEIARAVQAFRRRAMAPPLPPAEGRQTRLRGWLRAGVEHRSVVLVDESGKVLAQLRRCPPELVGGHARMVVTGVFEHDLLTTAQQGAPFLVQHVEPDGG